MLGYSIFRCEVCDYVLEERCYGHLETMLKIVAVDEGPLCRVCSEPLILFEQIRAANADRTC
jgi:hypothetical protein